MKNTILSMALLISGVLMQCAFVSNANSNPLTSSWLTGFDGVIVTGDQATSYPYQVGIFRVDIVKIAKWQVTEIKNGVTERDSSAYGFSTANINTSLYPEFSGSSNLKYRVHSSSYGQWYARIANNGCGVKLCVHVLFVPDFGKINRAINPGDTIKSIFTYDLGAGLQSSLSVIIVTDARIALSIAPRELYSTDVYVTEVFVPPSPFFPNYPSIPRRPRPTSTTNYRGHFIVTSNYAPGTDVPYRYRNHNANLINTHPTVKISANQTTQTIDIATGNPESLTISLVADSNDNYTVGSPSSATVYFVSASKPGISIEIVDSDTLLPVESINQGERFKIKATATPTPTSILTVNISIAPSPSGVITPSANSVPITINASETEGFSGELSTATNGTVNGGAVTFTVPTSNNYRIHPVHSSASLTVDVAPPVTLSIAPKTPYFSTGGSATFKVTADPAPAINVPFKYYLTDPAQLETVSVPAGQTTYEFSPSGAPSSADVTVNLASSTDNRYVLGTQAATVYYETTTSPGISISFVEVGPDDSETDIAAGESIDQGERFKIKATATPEPTTNLTISISIAQTPSDLIQMEQGASLPDSITINSSGNSAGTGLSDVLSTYTDGTVNGGTVTITLATGSNYSIHTDPSPLTASLTVDATPVTLSIAPKAPYFSTGDSAAFIVTANPVPPMDMRFQYYLPDTVQIQSGNIPAGQRTYEFMPVGAPTDANVNVNLAASNRYVLGTQSAATVYFVSVANPGVSISFVEVGPDDSETAIASGGSIDMGDRFKIKATATPAPSSPLTVNINVSKVPSGIIDSASSIPSSITIPAYANQGLSGVLSTATDGRVNGGTVTATVPTNASYVISTGQNPLMVSLTVDAAPSVTLSIAPKTPYFSTGSAKFIVSADSASKINLPFRYYLSDDTQIESDTVPAGQTTFEFTPTGASSSANVTVNLADSADSAVSRYVKGTPNAATVYFTTESSPGISISFVEADGTDITEGGSIDRGEQFKIKATATPAPTEDLTVSISISEAPVGIITPATNSVSIPIDTTGTGLSGVLMTSRGAVGGTVTVRLESAMNNEYMIHTAPLDASLTVNANTVILTIAPKKPFYSRDGADVTFIVTADPAPAMDLPIRYHMYDNVIPQPANENDKVSAGETTYELTIRAMQNVDYTKVRLARSSGYRLGNPNIAKVFHPDSGEPGITISFVKVKVIGRTTTDEDLAEGEGINREQKFKIKATATPDPTNNVIVKVRVEFQQDVITGSPTNGGTVNIRINSSGTTVTEGKSTEIMAGTEDGDVTVTLVTNPNSSYKIHSDFSVATLTVSGASSASGSSGSDGEAQGESEEDQRRRSMASTVRAIQPTVIVGSAESTEDALESQFNLAFSGGGSSFTLGGNSSLTDALTFSGEVANGRTVSLEDFISGSSFKLQLFPEEGGSGMASIWGVGDSLGMSGTGSDSNLSWDGSMLTGHLGFDVRVDRKLVFGLASSFSEAETKYANDNDAYGNGTYRSRNVSMHPYLGWKSLDGTAEVRSSIGYGTGEIQVTQDGYAPETAATGLAMLSVAGSRALYSADETVWGGRSELRVKGDTWATHQFVHDNNSLIDNMQFAVSHGLFAAEASHMWELSSGSTVNPGLLIGIERDGRDERTELGVVAGGEISYGNPLGFTASGSMSGPLSGDVMDFGLLGLLDYDFASDGLGLVMKVSSAWGDSESGDKLFSNDVAILNADTAQSKHNFGSKHGVEMGYGLEIFDDSAMLVSFSGVELVDGQADVFRLGSRMAVGSDISVELSWNRAVRSDETSRGLNLSGDFKW